MSYDTLYGLNNRREPLPQMVSDHVVEDDGLTWRLTLRDGLRLHDGEPVPAHPPFDNPRIRRALLGVVDQSEIMSAIAGTDPTHWDKHVGVFCPESSAASDAGMTVLTSKRDPAAARRALTEAGYAGEKVTLISPAPSFALSTQDLVVADQFKRAGADVDLVSLDFGTWLRRRNPMAPPDEGGWNMLSTTLFGEELWDPAAHATLRSNGKAAWPGWPTDAKLEGLRDQWFQSPNETVAHAICRQVQEEAFTNVAYIPTGRYKDVTGFRNNLKGMLSGTALFHNIEKT